MTESSGHLSVFPIIFSIPRFKYTGEIKGFAFVEFESEKEAQEALQVFDLVFVLGANVISFP